jgi:hypothetical protein
MARKLPRNEQYLFSKPSQSAGEVLGAAGFSASELREMMIANFAHLEPAPAPEENTLSEEEESKDD